jgi:tetratricopeptide (TPR) repeat protein
MGLFDIFKKTTPGTPWRTNDGKLSCPGDSCPRDCDELCPIWCQTTAITYMQCGHHELAIEQFKKALTLAPDYKEAWCNLAAVYGTMNNHMEANKTYKAAYMLDKKYKNALFGLIISSKNLGQLEEALKYCEEYEKVGDSNQIKDMKNEIADLIKKGNTVRRESAIEMASKIIAQAREFNILGENNHLPHIPEIMVEGARTCQVVFNEVIKEEDGKNPRVWMMWGAFAGMGAVYHWHTDWDALKRKGIPETLLAPRGAFAMDEYVIDSIGLGWDTEEGKEFNQSIMFLTTWVLVEFMKGLDESNFLQTALEVMQAMYIFGMVYEMERLGMR